MPDGTPVERLTMIGRGHNLHTVAGNDWLQLFPHRHEDLTADPERGRGQRVNERGIQRQRSSPSPGYSNVQHGGSLASITYLLLGKTVRPNGMW